MSEKNDSLATGAKRLLIGLAGSENRSGGGVLLTGGGETHSDVDEEKN